jgi:hypothetical protein
MAAPVPNRPWRAHPPDGPQGLAGAMVTYSHGGPGTLGPPIYLRTPHLPESPRGEGGRLPWSTTVLVN